MGELNTCSTGPSRPQIDRARSLLQMAGVFFENDPDNMLDPGDRGNLQTLDMNDTFGWALAFGEYVPDMDLPEVARLFRDYGYCGLYYWVSEKNGGMPSEFFLMSRKIEFVRHEEKLRKRLGFWTSLWAYCNEGIYVCGVNKLNSSLISRFVAGFKKWLTRSKSKSI